MESRSLEFQPRIRKGLNDSDNFNDNPDFVTPILGA